MVASPGGVDPLAGAADAARRSSKLPTDKSYDYLRMTLDYAYGKPTKKDASKSAEAAAGPDSDMALA